MPIKCFDNSTFVAFLDISGFKELMKKEQAVKALDKLYSIGYQALAKGMKEENNKVEGFFFSDAGILFVRNKEQNLEDQLEHILEVIEKINRQMLRHNFMLTTSVAYGPFRYSEKIEFVGIEKNPVYGNAYVNAFLDNDKTSPRIQPGQCRIIKRELPQNLLINRLKPNLSDRIKDQGDYYYFYWMIDEGNEIEKFNEQYNDSYNLKYSGMLQALKRNIIL
jgi:hypothetical protein